MWENRSHERGREFAKNLPLGVFVSPTFGQTRDSRKSATDGVAKVVAREIICSIVLNPDLAHCSNRMRPEHCGDSFQKAEGGFSKNCGATRLCCSAWSDKPAGPGARRPAR
jgi:hypothetical protein